MRNPCVFLLLTLLASPAAAAELRAGYGNWRYDLSGTVTEGGRTYDLRSDFDVKARGRDAWFLEWDTPAGPWPDIGLAFNEFGADGRQDRTFQVFDLLGQPVGTQTESLATTAEFEDLEFTARYPFMLGPVRVALGLSIKKIEGEVLIEDSTASPTRNRQSYDETIPELHAQLRLPLGKAVALTTTGQGISGDGDRALEWRAALELRALAPLLLEAGWQHKRYELNLDSRSLDARFDGALLRGGWLWR